MDDRLLLFWGKARPSAPGSPNFHPALLHCLDVAAAASALIGEGFAAGLEPLAPMLPCLAALHDLGKFTRGFQQQCPEHWPEPDGVTLHLASGEQGSGDVLIGADGVHSRIRQQMFGQGRAKFTGIMAWRGLVPMERLPPHQQRLVGANWMGVGGHVVTYPLLCARSAVFPAHARMNQCIGAIWTMRSPNSQPRPALRTVPPPAAPRISPAQDCKSACATGRPVAAARTNCQGPGCSTGRSAA